MSVIAAAALMRSVFAKKYQTDLATTVALQAILRERAWVGKKSNVKKRGPGRPPKVGERKGKS